MQEVGQVTLLELSKLLEQLQLIHLMLLLEQVLLQQQLLSLCGSNLLIQVILAGLPLVFEVVHQQEILTALEVLLKSLAEIGVARCFLYLPIFVFGVFVTVVAG